MPLFVRHSPLKQKKVEMQAKYEIFFLFLCLTSTKSFQLNTS